jgi:glycine betaine catabolism B
MAAVYRSRLVGSIPRVADVVTYQLERPDGHTYQAGQWFVLTIPGATGPLEHHFSYSGPPTAPWLEFTTRVRDSEFKTALRHMKTGAEVKLEGPYGMFVLPPGSEPVAFLVGGIGITCVRSILSWCATRPAGPPREMVLIYSNHSEEAVPFAEELAELEGKLAGLRVVHVISQPGEAWTGHRGHIDAGLLRRELIRPERWLFYASGPSGFSVGMGEMLESMGIDRERVTLERFEGYEYR